VTHLILERVFDPPLSVADVYERVRTSDWCFDLHRLNWDASFLSADGRTMVCSFSAPDAESARIALRQTGADVQRLWTTSVYEPPVPITANVVVERSPGTPDTFERLHALAESKRWCFEHHQVRWSRSFASSDGRRMLCLYEAPDVESVRLAQREAGLPVERVWAFTRVSRDTMPSVP
jgi:hypothetical protein